MRYYATYFDGHFLSRALAMHASLKEQGSAYRLFALCWDKFARDGILALGREEIVVITPAEVEAFEPGLTAAKQGRTLFEIYFTFGPAFLEYCFSKDASVDLLTFVDSDLYFFSDPEPLFQEMGEASVGMVSNRYSPRFKNAWKKFGRYNVGWNTFRRDENGLGCLKWWKERCIEWCYNMARDSKYADQKYLDEWPDRFLGVHVWNHPGANLAPWNIAGSKVEEVGGSLRVDGQPLIFFHFSGFKEIFPWLFDTNLGRLGRGGRTPQRLIKERIFLPYIRELRRHPLPGKLERRPRSFELRGSLLVDKIRVARQIAFALLNASYMIDVPEHP